MTLDRPHARQAFAEYTSHYNAADPKVKLKIDHTYRVAALCERIANSLSLPPQDVDLAWLCGLLHSQAGSSSCAATARLSTLSPSTTP